MTHDEVVELITGLEGTVVTVASEENGDPEVAWGDSFFFYDPDGITDPQRRLPYATIVVSDYPGFDEASDLNREGIFRVNLWVSPDSFDRFVLDEADVDYAALDEIIPHPVYAKQSWLSVLNPGPATEATLRDLLVEAHDRALDRYGNRS
jgi:hypothetical protein